MTPLSLGYVPLLDAAPLIVAHEMGFAGEEGLMLMLRAAPSWSAVRDMLGVGAVDAAHMLAPVPVAAALGLGGASVPMVAAAVMSVNGTVIGVSNALAHKLYDAGHRFDFDNAEAAGNALIGSGSAPLRVGVPFPFSMHSELLIYWLSALGLPAPQNVDIRTVPPSLMADAIKADEIDVFCVGEPWGSRVVERGAGTLLLPGCAIWSYAPEKVLAMRQDWPEDNPHVRGRLIRAIVKAGRWLADPASRTVAAEILARAEYLDLPPEILDRGLGGQLVISSQGEQRRVSGFVEFSKGAANFPWRSQGQWIGLQLARRMGLDRQSSMLTAGGVFRSDYYRAAFAGTGEDVPSASAKVEGATSSAAPASSASGRLTLARNQFFDCRVFDPDAHQ